MNSKKITIIIAFTALTIALNPIRIPTIYWPGFFYRLWEIPIVVAFLLFGPRIGIAIGTMNALSQIILFPLPAGILAYPWGLVATLSMLAGLYFGQRILKLNRTKYNQDCSSKPILVLTFFGIVFRACIMPFVDYAVYNSLLPIALGRTFTETYVLALIPGIIIFNIIVPLYTIPVSYLVAKKISGTLKFGKQFNLGNEGSI
jgi:riboflavin transporter FmnP